MWGCAVPIGPHRILAEFPLAGVKATLAPANGNSASIQLEVWSNENSTASLPWHSCYPPLYTSLGRKRGVSVWLSYWVTKALLGHHFRSGKKDCNFLSMFLHYPDWDHNGWVIFIELRFPKIYNTWSVMWQIAHHTYRTSSSWHWLSCHAASYLNVTAI